MKKVSTILAAAMLLSAGSVSYAQSVKQRTLSQLSGKTPAEIAAVPDGGNGFAATAQAQLRVPQKEIQSFWLGSSWMPVQEISYQYNNKGQVATSEATSALSPGILRTTHSYDAQDRDTLELQQIRIGSSLINESRTRTKYDAQGHMTYLGMFEWNRNTNSWDIDAATKHTHTYDASNRLMQTVTAEYEDNAWVEVAKSVYEYTGSSALPVSITSYARMEGQWVAEERLVNLVYTQQQFEQSYVLQLTDGGGANAWYNHSRHAFSYTSHPASNSFKIVEVKDAFQNNTWVPSARSSIELTNLGHLVQYKEEYHENGQWVVNQAGSQTNQIATDAQGSITELVYRLFDEEEAEETNFMKHEFSNFATITIAGVAEEVLAAATVVYPNPATDRLNIALDAAKVKEANLSIYSLSGQKMYELPSLRGEASVDISHFPGGIYFVRLAGANSSITQKFVKQ